MRAPILLALLAQLALPCAAELSTAVEFPYDRHPRGTWERELVWLKNIGVETVAFGIPAGAPDAAPFLALLRRLELRAWVRTHSPVAEKDLARHGGPVVWIEGAAPVPEPVTEVSAIDPQALFRSRAALAGGRGTLLWTDVEETLSRAGEYRSGVVSFAGDERAGAAVLRREVALWRAWGPLLARAHTAGAGVVNAGAGPATMRPRVGSTTLPEINVPPREALWLPAELSLAASGMCEDCAVFAPADRIVYATAELHRIEFENGILALEFYAPSAAEVVLRLTQRPSGPLIAGGRPREFDWDAAESTARISIPAGKAPGYQVRVGLAIEAPSIAGFFKEAKRLMLGRANVVAASFSSGELAARARLRAPARYQVRAIPRSDLAVDYEVTPPADALHGERVELALEADGVRLGRARVQLLRTFSVRFPDAAALHFGEAALPSDPPLVASAGELRLVLRNHDPAIRNYALEARCEGVELLPQRAEIAVAGAADREFTLRAVPDGGLHACRVTVDGVETWFRLALLKRGEAMAYQTDLDGDGIPEWILENRKLRAVFSGKGGGRWMEFVHKESGWNALPAAGTPGGAGEITARGGREAWLIIQGKAGRRTVRLGGEDSAVAIEQDEPLPAETLTGGKSGGVFFDIERSDPRRAWYRLERR